MKQTHFELFQLPATFAVDQAALDAAFREIQGRVHPDRFVNASDTEKRVAMQWATRANEAYATLRNPQKRAQYLCEINGVDLQTESNTAMPAAFLMQQMEWREALEDARAAKDAGALDELDAQVRRERKAMLEQVGRQLDGGDYHGAAQTVRAMMFLDKFGEEVQYAFEALDA
ncbi:Fe-S protein assembly co-chaperone HscB [Massilia consociata]|uniref:Co-chaperone protein HscB homolog n=1 Tax=Massilia consociata TaxID=760117 RepID=A0ABV6FK45_9BURK